MARGQHPQLTAICKEGEPGAGKARFCYLDSVLILSVVICQTQLHRTGSSAASTQRVHVTLAGQVLQHRKDLDPASLSQR